MNRKWRYKHIFGMGTQGYYELIIDALSLSRRFLTSILQSDCQPRDDYVTVAFMHLYI